MQIKEKLIKKLSSNFTVFSLLNRLPFTLICKLSSAINIAGFTAIFLETFIMKPLKKFSDSGSYFLCTSNKFFSQTSRVTSFA